MAFYNSFDSYYNSYDSYYDSFQIDPPIPQPINEPTIFNLFDYPTPHFAHHNFNDEPVDHGYSISYTSNPCSASSYSEPTVIEYDPNSYYQQVTTQFAISYSVAPQFNEVEFEEYDPTPYSGGYDISQTYGNPLEPSIQICYPKSGTAIVATPKPPIEEPPSKTEPARVEKDGDKGSLPDLGSGFGNYGRALSELPSGWGLEAVDLCEGLFGHWPCLARIKRQTASHGCGRCPGHCRCRCYGNYYSSQWEGAADYLFGSHDPYPDGVYGYQRLVQGEPGHGYVWFDGVNQNV